jgi:hypothetical protein
VLHILVITLLNLGAIDNHNPLDLALPFRISDQ